MQNTAAMRDVEWGITIPIVFCFHVVEGLIRNVLHDMALRLPSPFERSIGCRLIGIVDHDRVVRTRGAEKVPPLRRAVVNKGSRIRENFRTTDIHNKRQGVCMSVTAVEHAEPSTVEDDLAAMRAPSGPLNGITRSWIENVCLAWQRWHKGHMTRDRGYVLKPEHFLAEPGGAIGVRHDSQRSPAVIIANEWQSSVVASEVTQELHHLIALFRHRVRELKAVQLR